MFDVTGGDHNDRNPRGECLKSVYRIPKFIRPGHNSSKQIELDKSSRIRLLLRKYCELRQLRNDAGPNPSLSAIQNRSFCVSG